MWSQLYSIDNKPSFEDIDRFIGDGVNLWRRLLSFIEETYGVQPQLSYSKCSMQLGWNVKYSKSGKSLCTLYPMAGYFIALVVIGLKETTEAELALPTLSPYTLDLFNNTQFSCGGRWLMIEVKNENILEDVKRLISIRVRPKK